MAICNSYAQITKGYLQPWILFWYSHPPDFSTLHTDEGPRSTKKSHTQKQGFRWGIETY